MKTFFTSLFVFLITLSALGKECIVKNGDFSTLSRVQLPLAWELHAKRLSSCQSISDDKKTCVRLQSLPEDGHVFLIQRNLPLKQNSFYMVTYLVKSENSSRYRVYVEWREPDAKRGSVLKSKNGYFQKADTNWTKKSFKVDFPRNAFSGYIVLNVKGKADVKFSDIKIIEIK
jgi:hypothetical protein